MVLSRNVYTLFFIFLLFGMVFTDLPIGEKTVMHSPMFIIAPLVCCLIILSEGFKLDFRYASISKYFFLYTILTFFSSIIMLFFAVIKNGFFVHETNLIIKLFESFFSGTLLHFIVYYSLVACISRMSYETLERIFFYVALFFIVCAIIEYIKPELLYIFHADKYEYNRLRLTSPESSQAVLNFSIFIMLYLFFEESKARKTLIFFFSFLVLIGINSKGGFLSLLLASLILLLLSIKNMKITFLVITTIVILMLIIFKATLPGIIQDINQFTSFSTRISGLASIVWILIFFPIGTGYGAYLYFYPEVLINTFNTLNNFVQKIFQISLNSYEIDAIISTGVNVGAKAALPQLVMYSGWLGLLFFVYIFYKTHNNLLKLHLIESQNKFLLKFLLIFLFIQLIIGSEYTLLYSIWLPIAFIEGSTRKSYCISPLIHRTKL